MIYIQICQMPVISNKGPSIKDVRKKSRKIDPFLLVPADTPYISKNPMFFAPKSANVRIWRTPLFAKCPHWTNPLSPDCGCLLSTAPKR